MNALYIRNGMIYFLFSICFRLTTISDGWNPIIDNPMDNVVEDGTDREDAYCLFF